MLLNVLSCCAGLAVHMVAWRACMHVKSCLLFCFINCIAKSCSGSELAWAVDLLLSQGCFVTPACAVLRTLHVATSVTLWHGVGLVPSWVSKHLPWDTGVLTPARVQNKDNSRARQCCNACSEALCASTHCIPQVPAVVHTRLLFGLTGLHTDVHSGAVILLEPLLCTAVAAALVSVEPWSDRV
jgi:hypothetical protein